MACLHPCPGLRIFKSYFETRNETFMHGRECMNCQIPQCSGAKGAGGDVVCSLSLENMVANGSTQPPPGCEWIPL